MRKFLTALAPVVIAGGALLPTSALAQTAAPNLVEVENEAVMVEAFGVSVDDLEDTDIFDAAGKRIGEIDEVLMTPDGKIVAVSAEVGGFLGINDREVVVELGQIRRVGDKLQIDMTKDQIEALPVWDD